MHVPALGGEDDQHGGLSFQHLDVAHRAYQSFHGPVQDRGGRESRACLQHSRDVARGVE